MPLKICLDAGHGENVNPGALAGYFEGNAMYALAAALKSELAHYRDVEVFLSRAVLKENPDVCLRGDYAGRQGCQVLLSLHSDAFSDPTAAGVSVFRSLKRPDSEELGRRLGTAIAGAMDTRFRGVLTREWPGNGDYYGVLRSAVAHPGVEHAFLLEHGFHSNPAECARLMDPATLAALARAEAAVIAQHYGLRLAGEERTVEMVRVVELEERLAALTKENEDRRIQRERYSQRLLAAAAAADALRAQLEGLACLIKGA